MTLDPTQLVTLEGLEATFTDPRGAPLFRMATVRGRINADLDRFDKRCVVKPGGQGADRPRGLRRLAGGAPKSTCGSHFGQASG